MLEVSKHVSVVLIPGGGGNIVSRPFSCDQSVVYNYPWYEMVSLLLPFDIKRSANLANFERFGSMVVCWQAGQHTIWQPFTIGQDMQAGCSKGLN